MVVLTIFRAVDVCPLARSPWFFLSTIPDSLHSDMYLCIDSRWPVVVFHVFTITTMVEGEMLVCGLVGLVWFGVGYPRVLSLPFLPYTPVHARRVKTEETEKTASQKRRKRQHHRRDRKANRVGGTDESILRAPPKIADVKLAWLPSP